MFASALVVFGARTCLATPVHADVVRAGPFTGYITPGHDVVAGRFRLHLGAYRVPGGLTQKIPWFVPLRYRVGDTLVLTGPAPGPVAAHLPADVRARVLVGLVESTRLPVDHRPTERRLLAAHAPQRKRRRHADNARVQQVVTARRPRVAS